VLARRAGETVTLGLTRAGKDGKRESLEKQVTLRDRVWPELSMVPDSPVSVPSLGVSYKVLAKIHAIDADGPAAKAAVTKDGKPAGALAVGDEVVVADFVLPKSTDEEQAKRVADKQVAWPIDSDPFKINADHPNWPVFFTSLQALPPGTKVSLELADGRVATFAAGQASDWFQYDRGFRFGPEMAIIKADNFKDALVLGGRETKDSLLMVYSFLRRIGTQVSPFALGGPVTIARAAGGEASEGISRLLLFLTMLSANLAVINFLPIPLLDGGHMVFLILEGILRRPVSEKIVVAFHYVGFMFIISLMMFVLGLDVGLIPRF
jgi:regulator of sigma E protease